MKRNGSQPVGHHARDFHTRFPGVEQQIEQPIEQPTEVDMSGANPTPSALIMAKPQPMTCVDSSFSLFHLRESACIL